MRNYPYLLYDHNGPNSHLSAMAAAAAGLAGSFGAQQDALMGQAAAQQQAIGSLDYLRQQSGLAAALGDRESEFARLMRGPGLIRKSPVKIKKDTPLRESLQEETDEWLKDVLK